MIKLIIIAFYAPEHHRIAQILRQEGITNVVSR